MSTHDWNTMHCIVFVSPIRCIWFHSFIMLPFFASNTFGFVFFLTSSNSAFMLPVNLFPRNCVCPTILYIYLWTVFKSRITDFDTHIAWEEFVHTCLHLNLLCYVWIVFFSLILALPNKHTAHLPNLKKTCLHFWMLIYHAHKLIFNISFIQDICPLIDLQWMPKRVSHTVLSFDIWHILFKRMIRFHFVFAFPLLYHS